MEVEVVTDVVAGHHPLHVIVDLTTLVSDAFTAANVITCPQSVRENGVDAAGLLLISVA